MVQRIFLTAAVGFDENEDVIYASDGEVGFEVEVTGERGRLNNGVGTIDDRLGILDQAPIRFAPTFSFSVGASKFTQSFHSSNFPNGIHRARVILKSENLENVLFRGVITSAETEEANAKLILNCENPLDAAVRKILPLLIESELANNQVSAFSAVEQMLQRVGADVQDPLIADDLKSRDYKIDINILEELSNQFSSVSWIDRIIRPISLYVAEGIDGALYLADRVRFGVPQFELTEAMIESSSLRVREIIEAEPLNAIRYSLPLQSSDTDNLSANRISHTHPLRPVVAGDELDVFSIADLVSGRSASVQSKRVLPIYSLIRDEVEFPEAPTPPNPNEINIGYDSVPYEFTLIPNDGRLPTRGDYAERQVFTAGENALYVRIHRSASEVPPLRELIFVIQQTDSSKEVGRVRGSDLVKFGPGIIFSVYKFYMTNQRFNLEQALLNNYEKNIIQLRSIT